MMKSPLEFGIDLETMERRIDESRAARRAVFERRRDLLCEGIDALRERLTDAETMVSGGRVTWEYAIDTLIKPQIERLSALKAEFLDDGSLPQ